MGFFFFFALFLLPPASCLAAVTGTLASHVFFPVLVGSWS